MNPDTSVHAGGGRQGEVAPLRPLVQTLHICACGHECVTWQPFLKAARETHWCRS